MGAYISQSSVEGVYGIANVSAWAKLEDATVVATQVALAITWAESHVDDRLRGARYAIPISNVA